MTALSGAESDQPTRQPRGATFSFRVADAFGIADQ